MGYEDGVFPEDPHYEDPHAPDLAEKTWPVTSVGELVTEIARLTAELERLRAQDASHYAAVLQARARVQAVRDLCDEYPSPGSIVEVEWVLAAIGDTP